MSGQATLWDTGNAIGSPALESGRTPCALPAGKMAEKSGPDHAPVSPSPQQEKAKATRTSATYGRTGIGSFESAAQESFSGSRSPAVSSSDQPMKTCSVCGASKPLTDFRKYSGATPDGRRPLCKPCQRDYEKNWRNRSGDKLRKARWIRSPKAQAYARKYRAENRAAYLVAECRRRCTKHGIPFDLDVQQLQTRINAGKCEVSGYALDVRPLTERYQRRPDSPSLDRINPKKGYVMSNVRVVCLAVNLALSNWGEAVLLPILKAWMAKK